MTTEQDPKPVAAEAVASALVENASRLGLTWDLRPAMVQNTDPLSIIYDNDTIPIGATSMIGPLEANARVYALVVPPAGNFVVGAPTVPSFALTGSTIGTAYWVGGATAGSTGTEVPLTAWNVLSTFNLQPKRVAMLTCVGGIVTNNTSVISSQQVRVRAAVNSTSATQLGFYQTFIAPGFGSVVSFCNVSYIQNTGSLNAQFDVGVTNQRIGGAGTNSIFGDSNIPLVVVGIDMGPFSNPALDAIRNIAALV